MSPLDAVSKKMVAHLMSTREFLRTVREQRPRTMLLLNGLDVKRWLLKTLCGLVTSGTIEVRGIADPREWRPPLEWLEVIFGIRPMVEGCGLYFLSQPDERTEIAPKFCFACVSNAQLGVGGLAASFVEKRFGLFYGTITRGMARWDRSSTGAH